MNALLPVSDPREELFERLWFEVYSARCGHGVEPHEAEHAASAAVCHFRSRLDRQAAERRMDAHGF